MITIIYQEIRTSHKPTVYSGMILPFLFRDYHLNANHDKNTKLWKLKQ